MPIKHSVTIRPVSEDEFHSIDYKVMDVVFSAHRALGRLCDEKIYQNALLYRCQAMGFDTVTTEVPIQVSYKDFRKFYYMDLLINNAVMYELKTVNALTPEHRKQALNYLLLMGMHHGKLVNMRPNSVEYSFVSTRLTPEKRYQFTFDDQEWNNLDNDSVWLKQLICSLLSEWGAFLDTNLFYDAIKYFRGGEAHVVKRIDIIYDSRVMGAQNMYLLNADTAFQISAITKGTSSYEDHLRRLINHTSLRVIQWINFNHDIIEFKTLAR